MTLWVVEMDFGDDDCERWEPTVGVALSRADGRAKLDEWRDRNVSDNFRLTRYGPVSLSSPV